MATVQSWVCSRSGRVAWIAPLPFKALISKKRDQRGRRFTFPKNRWTYSHTLFQSHQNNATRIQAQHLFQSENKRCQKHVQNKIAWRHQSKKKNKGKERHVKSKIKKSLFPVYIRCFLWPVLLFSDQAQRSPELKALLLFNLFYFIFFYSRWYNHMDFKIYWSSETGINEKRKNTIRIDGN